MFSVLVALLLLKAVMVPELFRFTIPAALLVMPVMVPDPLRFIVPVFVKFASAVLVAPAPVFVIVPALASVVIEIVPLEFSVPDAAFVKLPLPLNSVPTVNDPLFVTVTVVIVVVGIDSVPLSACARVVNVYAPVPAVNVPLLFVTPPRKLIAEFPELFQLPVEFIVTRPV